MNQILITGDEQIESKATENVKKEKKVLPINGIVIFYAFSIIVLGICMIGGSVYARDQINKTVEASIRPEITVERNDDDNTISINVTHIRGLKNVVYKWNDDEEKTIDAIQNSAGFIRSVIAKRINLRITPELVFEKDDSMEYGMRIDSIIKNLNK